MRLSWWNLLPWVRDGLELYEQEMACRLGELGRGSWQALRAIADKQWLQDGASPAGASVLATLFSMASDSSYRSDEVTALKIIDMPFLDEIDGVDTQVMRLLWRLVRNSDDRHLQTVLSHPTLLGGITDDQTVPVAAMNLVWKSHPELVEVLLDPGRTTIERRLIELPYTGEMVLSVIHLTPGGKFPHDGHIGSGCAAAGGLHEDAVSPALCRSARSGHLRCWRWRKSKWASSR